MGEKKAESISKIKLDLGINRKFIRADKVIALKKLDDAIREADRSNNPIRPNRAEAKRLAGPFTTIRQIDEKTRDVKNWTANEKDLQAHDKFFTENPKAKENYIQRTAKKSAK
jgi:hypothetical protein